MSILLAQAAVSGVRGLLRAVHPADAADVLLLATVLFGLIGWLRRTGSGRAARRAWGFAVAFGLLYLLADRLGLYLTTRLLRGLVLVLVVTVVIVFQSDLRRLLDRLLTWEFPRSPAPVHSPVELLVSTIAALAERRTGALVAVRGSDPWGAFVSGGVELDGRISRPLLQSIFDPSSDGHDGAVLVEGDRITRFAVHLPLARTIPAVSRFGGTRHAAALGLAEARDAFVIVVSEERGAVSVARDGALTELPSAAALAPLLEAFWTAHYGRSAGRAASGGRRWVESAGAALAVACIAWLLFSYSGDTVDRSFSVPVEVRNFPAGWALDNDTVPTAVLTVSGSPRAMSQLNPAALMVGIDLAWPRPGLNRVPIADGSAYLPPGIRFVAAEPRYVDVVAHRLVAATLPVRIRTTAPVADSLLLSAHPAALQVLFPPGESQPRELFTVPVDLARLRRDQDVRTEVVLPAGTRLTADQPAEVRVRMTGRRAR
ncbi:MAG TPA: diadenylate cyclase [Longimicrobium sp.]|jgi:DNA integrity scanning protein DisA with diadenylate cyclase activity|nr:diadenylate cyclase [Longimicrobium sp.]